MTLSWNRITIQVTAGTETYWSHITTSGGGEGSCDKQANEHRCENHHAKRTCWKKQIDKGTM